VEQIRGPCHMFGYTAELDTDGVHPRTGWGNMSNFTQSLMIG